MLEDLWGGGTWRREWREVPRARRRQHLAELRRGEVLRPTEEALLAIRAAKAQERWLPLRAVVSVLGFLLVTGVLLQAFAPIPTRDPAGAAGVAASPVVGWLLIGLAVLWRERRSRRALRTGIDRNVQGLGRWVEDGRPADLGPPSAREAALLRKLIDDEGWTRPHR
jgi:hypothetical protein